MAARTLLKGGRILTMDPTVGEIDGDVLIEGNRIAAIGKDLTSEGATVLDASRSLVMPGFIDTHHHAWQSVVRFYGVGWDVGTYMARAHRRIAPRVTPQDAYLGDLLTAFASLDAGTTTICDESHVQHSRDHTDHLIAALRESGIRARFGYGWSAGPQNTLGSTVPHPADLERVRSDVLFDDSALVTMYAMLRGPILAHPDTCLSDLARARAAGLRSSFHLAQSNTADRREITFLADEQVLGSDMCFIHCGAATDREFQLMAAAGVGLSVSAAIESVMSGVGIPATARAVRAGLRPSLSVDTEISVAGDMFGVMRAAFAADQLRRIGNAEYASSHPALTAQDILEFATIAGAKAVGLGDVVGSISVGKRADILLVDRFAPNLISNVDSATALVTAGHAGNVKTVFVDGQLCKTNGALVDAAKLGEARDQSAEAYARLTRGLDRPGRR